MKDPWMLRPRVSGPYIAHCCTYAIIGVLGFAVGKKGEPALSEQIIRIWFYFQGKSCFLLVGLQRYCSFFSDFTLIFAIVFHAQ